LTFVGNLDFGVLNGCLFSVAYGFNNGCCLIVFLVHSFLFIYLFFNRMQIQKKFKQCVEDNLHVNNELTSFMMEYVTLVGILVANETTSSHELVGANEQA